MKSSDNQTKAREVAIVRDARVAIEDHSHEVCIVLSAYTSEATAADHWIGPSSGPAFLSLWNAMRGNVANLNGKPCWVHSDGVGMRQEFIEMWSK